MRAPALVSVWLLATASASPGWAASADPQATNGKPTRPERMVCRREAVMGSHFKRRVCRTESEILAERQYARDELERMQSHRNEEIRMETMNNR